MTTTSDVACSPHAVEERWAYVHSLDGVRGLAALVVVLYHVEYFHAWFARGYLAVDLFFILSGFVLTHRYGGQPERRGGFARFAWARLARLYPLHLATLAALAFAELVLGHYGKHAVIQGDLGYSFFLNLLLLQAVGFYRLAQLEYLGVVHIRRTLVEPVVVSFTCHPVDQALRQALVDLGLGGGLWLLVQHAPLIDYHMEKVGAVTTALLRCAVGFCCGALICYARRQVQPFSHGALPLAALAVLLIVVFKPEYMDYWVVAVVFPLLIVASLASARESRWVRFLEWRPVAWLGVISYSVYLNHLLVIKAVNLVAARLDPLARGVLILLAVLGLSAITYRLIEAPARRWLLSLADRGSARRVPA